MNWLMKGSLKRTFRIAAGGGGLVIGTSLAFRQRHLRNQPILEAARTQLQTADAVREILGSPMASSEGNVRGYTDPVVGGTACLEFPIVSEGGVHAIARVEAEAEWVKLESEANARGETAPERPKSLEPRWLLRHLEIQPADAEPVTLYSLPPNAPLSPWAPSREPSIIPHWLRALVPEPSGVTHAEAFPRLIGVAGIAVLMHLLAFTQIQKRMQTEKLLRPAENLLALPETPMLQSLRDKAIVLASIAKNSNEPVIKQNGAVLYGKATSQSVVGYTALRDRKELYFRAERVGGANAKDQSSAALERMRKKSQGAAGARTDSWIITQVSVEYTALLTKKLTTLSETATGEEILTTLQSFPLEPMDLGTYDRRVEVRKS